MTLIILVKSTNYEVPLYVFSLASYYILSLRPKYSPQNPVSKHPLSTLSLIVDRHSYKRRGIVIFLYILISVLLDRK
jgi:hypothetical protein